MGDNQPTYESGDARKYFSTRMGELELEQQPHVPTWKEIKKYINPKYGRFENKLGTKNDDNILPDYGALLNNTPQQASKVNVAFIMAGMSSPARPWFKLIYDKAGRPLSSQSVAWLDKTRDLMLEIFARSNLYRALPSVYMDGILFGNGCMYTMDDDDDVMRFYHYPTGTYYWGLSHRLEIDTIYRPFQLTVKQVVERWGEENVSNRVLRKYKDNNGRNMQEMVDIVHAIEPNTSVIPRSARPSDKKKRYVSVYYETHRQADKNKLLSVSGFRDFPAMPFRIDVMGNDPYGTGTGADALGDCKELQHHELQKAMGMDYMNEPHLKSTGSIGEMYRHPSAVTPVNVEAGQDGLSPVYEVNYPIRDTLESIATIEGRIEDTFDNKLAVSVLNNKRSQTTAREIDAGEQEKMLLSGPKLESIQNLLSFVINRAFEIISDKKIGEAPPEELMGADLGVEYLGVLAQAQKAIGTRAIEKVLEFSAYQSEVLQGDLSPFDNLDMDEQLRDFADMVGSPSDNMKDREVVEAERAERAQKAQQQEQMAMADQMANTAKTMGDTPMPNDKSALTEALALTGG
jgi:hypothetical protein